MIEISKTADFDAWLGALDDAGARTRIYVRLDRLAHGNPGDMKAVGGGISELRIHYGGGYRVYLVRRGPTSVVLLFGGTKRTQERDLARAKALARLV